MAKHVHGLPNEAGLKEDPEPILMNKKVIQEQTTAGQYFRIANWVIKEKIDKIMRFQDGMRRFHEGGTLQNRIKTKKDLDKLGQKYITENDARDLIVHLEEDYEKTQDKLLCQEIIIEKTRSEITAKRKEIDEIKEKLEDALQKKQKIQEDATDPIEALKEELKKAGIDDKNQIYQLINEVAENLNMKKGQLKNG